MRTFTHILMTDMHGRTFTLFALHTRNCLIELTYGTQIDIPMDDGIGVCSEYTTSYWYFMTLEAPGAGNHGAGNHPVSGTRQFGFEPNGNGGYNFFVRGVDRIDSNIIQNALDLVSDNPFDLADNLWQSFQNKLNEFVNENGGESNKNAPGKYRPDWGKVKQVLMGDRPISDLGCK